MSKPAKVVSPWGKGSMRDLRTIDQPRPEPADLNSPAAANARAEAESAGGRKKSAGGNPPANPLSAGGNPPAEITSGRPQIQTAGGRKSDRRPADHKKLSLWFSSAKVREWKAFAAQAGLTLTDFLDLAASRFIETAASRTVITAGGNPPHDDHADLTGKRKN
jgi:hypothetical protein